MNLKPWKCAGCGYGIMVPLDHFSKSKDGKITNPLYCTNCAKPKETMDIESDICPSCNLRRPTPGMIVCDDCREDDFRKRGEERDAASAQEILDEEAARQKRRRDKIAVKLLQGWISGGNAVIPDMDRLENMRACASNAIDWADILIEELDK